MQADKACIRALYIVSMVAESAEVQSKCSVGLDQKPQVSFSRYLFMWCSVANARLLKNCAGTMVHICQD